MIAPKVTHKGSDPPSMIMWCLLCTQGYLSPVNLVFQPSRPIYEKALKDFMLK